MEPLILTVNTGSSSLKTALYDARDPLERVAGFDVSRVGRDDATVTQRDGAIESSTTASVADQREALRRMVHWLEERGYGRRLCAVGHRVVHGGPEYAEPQLASASLLDALRAIISIDPMHLPQAIDAIAELTRVFPDVPQVACFDTAFHRTMPLVAQSYPLPPEYREQGVVRYGFHGLSYEYVLGHLQRIDPAAARGRLVLAHLGNGASMCAVDAGRSIDTTMGFTPTGGLVMGTRSGDLDPGLLLYLFRDRGMSFDEVSNLVNNGAGLLGVSGTSSDMQDLLARRADDPHAKLAVDLFCYWARKHLGALIAVLGGLDMLVFTGGIGEHSHEVRDEICRDFRFLGLDLDPTLNRSDAPNISSAESGVIVRVIQTDEDMTIAEHTSRLLRARGDTRVRV